MTTPMQQVREKCAAVFARARELYGVDLSVVQIGFNLKGRVAGCASWKRRLGVSTYGLRFNHDMITRGDPKVLQDMLEDTVPHEIAHIVCYMRPELGRNHDSGWQRVCTALGGTGGRTHSMEVVFGKGNTYEYTTDRGNKVRLNERRHQAVQRGATLTYKRGLGSVRMGCAYSIVGVSGRTLAQPIVRQAMNHPTVIEEAVRAPQPSPEEMARRAAMVEELRRRQLTPVPTPAAPARPAATGESKAAISRRIMLSGYNAGHSYEQIIQAMMLANGYDRQLARATYKANAAKVGIPVQ